MIHNSKNNLPETGHASMPLGIFAPKNLAASLPSCLAAKKSAVTLAGVLITLCIIGVVAVFILPTLIENYQKHVYVKQLKQDVSVLENSLKKILANNNTNNLNNTPLYNETKFNKDYFISQTNFKEISNNSSIKFVKSMRKYYENYPMFYLNNGSCIAMEPIQWYGLQILYVDTNCDKQPNKIGYDQFRIRFESSGNLNADGVAFCPKDTLDKNNASFDSPPHIAVILGGGCFNKIVQDGWKIKY